MNVYIVVESISYYEKYATIHKNIIKYISNNKNDVLQFAKTLADNAKMEMEESKGAAIIRYRNRKNNTIGVLEIKENEVVDVLASPIIRTQ